MGKRRKAWGNIAKAWENIVELGKMSQSMGKCRKPKERITPEGRGKIVQKYREGGNISKERRIIIGKIIINNDNVRKLA